MAGQTVGIVGCGTMGAGIALVAAGAGYRVVVREQDEVRAAAGRGRLEGFTAESVRRGKLTVQAREEVLGRVAVTTRWEELAPCAVAVEAVYEDLAVKRAVLARLGEVLVPGALVATNTSCLSVTAIAAGYPRPGRVVGLHFFNPAPLVPLVEVAGGMDTDPAAVDEACAFAQSLGKEPVRTRDTPGFLVNRLLIPYLNQVIQAYDDGLASREDLDAAVELGLGYPVGALKLADRIGLDVHLQASEALYAELREKAYAPPPLLRRLVSAGRLGRKSGRGFYTYGQEG